MANVHCLKKSICAYAIGSLQNVTKLNKITGSMLEASTDTS
jgi:hypothetical protein